MGILSQTSASQIPFVEAASAFRQGGSLWSLTGCYLQPHGEQLQRPDSQEHEQEQLHLQLLAEFTLAFLRSLGWFLRFDFMVIDFSHSRRSPGIVARDQPAVHQS